MRWAIIIPLVLYLGVMLAIGVWAYQRRRQVTEDETAQYYLGGRSLGWFVLVFTLLASAASAGTFIGGPGLVYLGGYGWVLVSIFQVPTAFVALALLGKKFAILSRKLDLVTVTDFLRQRYEHPAVVIVSSVGVVSFLVAYMVPQFVGGARVLQAVTGVEYNTLLITFSGVVLLYTAFGGFLADAISDTFQGILMLLGGVVIWVALLTAIGGLGPVNETVTEVNPDLFTLPGPGGFTPHMIASYSLQLGLMFCVLPHLAVRSMSYRDSKAVHRAMAVGPAIMAVITLGFLTMGLVAHLYRPGLEVGDMALPLTLLDVLPDGVAGVLFAAPLAAIMSTVDSMILVVSGVIVRDLFKTYVKPDLSDHAGSRMGTMVSCRCRNHRDRARLQAAGVLGVPHHLRHRRSRGPALRADRRRSVLAAGQRIGRRIGDGRRRKLVRRRERVGPRPDTRHVPHCHRLGRRIRPLPARQLRRATPAP